MGREALGIGQGELGPAQGAFPRAQHIQMRDVAESFALPKPDADALGCHTLNRTIQR